MARRSGHEFCPSCDVCGLTPCPECDDGNQACLGEHTWVTCGVCGRPSNGTDHGHTIDEVRTALRRRFAPRPE